MAMEHLGSRISFLSSLLSNAPFRKTQHQEMETAYCMVCHILFIIYGLIDILIALIDGVKNNEAFRHIKGENNLETWTGLLKKLKLFEDDVCPVDSLRKRLVLGAAEWLSGMNGSKENEMSKFGYTAGEWEWIWSTMIEDGSWAVPAVTDQNGNYLKENFAPEMLIRYAAHELRCHIVVIDLQLTRIQFCSGNFLKDENVVFDSPLLLYGTGSHFQSVHPIDHDFFIQFANNQETINSQVPNRAEGRNLENMDSEAGKLVEVNEMKEPEKVRKRKQNEDVATMDENESLNKNIGNREINAEWEKRLEELRTKNKRSRNEQREYESLRKRKQRKIQSSEKKDKEKEANALRMKNVRANKSKESQEKEREKHAQGMKKARDAKNEESKAKEREQNAKGMKKARDAKDEESKAKDRQKNALAMKNIRKNQSKERQYEIKTEDKKRKQAEKQSKTIKSLFKLARQVDVSEFKENTSTHFTYQSNTNLYAQSPCTYCNALKWPNETPSFCCNSGKVKLPRIKEPPAVIKNLMKNSHFMDNIRGYNNSLALASIGSTNPESGPCFKIQGKLHHLIGSLTPDTGSPKFAQIYFFDTTQEIENRMANMNNLKMEVLELLQTCLHEVNPYIKHLKSAIEIARNLPNCRLVLNADARLKPSKAHARNYNLPTGSEVAVLLPGDQAGDLDVVLQTKGNEIQKISSVHRSYDALHYVLLLPYGDDGFQPGLPLINAKTGHVSIMQFYSYHLQVRGQEVNMLLGGHRLSQQYITDQYAKVERARLTWINQNQKTIKAEKYKGLIDAYDNGDVTTAGRRIILPPSVTYSPRWYTERYHDGMAITRKEGKPDLFLTLTCNPKWPEVQESLNPGENAFDRPDICARVFHMKFKELIDDVIRDGIFGKAVAHVETIEWQKRKGLPHLHLLLTLHKDDKMRDPSDIDKVISAEIPDPDINPRLFDAVTRHMIHGPCGKFNPNSPCMQCVGNSTIKTCSKGFPKQFNKSTEMSENSYPIYKRRSPADEGKTFDLVKGNKKYTVDNTWVVPYNPVLLLRYDCHSNVEFVATVLAVKYLYKYISKGPDRAIVKVDGAGGKDAGNTETVDEVQQFLDCRYLSAAESIWKLYGFSIHGKSHTVMKLSCHLPSEQTVFMEEGGELQALMAGEPETTLTAFFKTNSEDEDAKTILYPDFPDYYIWDNSEKTWKRRKQGSAIGRVPTVPFNIHTIELYCLRVLLHHIPGPTSYEDLRTVNGKILPSFHSTCIELGLMEDESELDRALEEAASLKFGDALRNFFVTLLIYVNPSNPRKLWDKHKDQLAADWVKDITLEKAVNRTLLWLRDKLASHEITLRQLNLPEPEDDKPFLPKLLEQELSYNKDEERELAKEAIQKMNREQRVFFDKVLDSISREQGGLFFLDAPGGTGKTFVLNALLCAVRSNGQIALGTAISAVASKLLKNGTTVHSRLKVPIQIKDTSLCHFSKNDSTGKLLLRTKLIIIDEVSMGHKHVYEAIDRSLRILKETDTVFASYVVVFAGDWRQCLPVIPRGSDNEIINATLKFSYLWKSIQVYHLKTNMRVVESQSEEGKVFANYLLSVGDGTVSRDDMIEIPEKMRIDPETLEALIDFVFYDLIKNSADSKWLGERAILCPTNEQAKEVNDLISLRFPGEEKIYKSSDTTENNNIDFTPEFLNSCDLPGIAPHCLKLKKGMLVMLLRNLDPTNGHCNGVKYVINNLLERVIEVTAVNGSNPGSKLLVPRIIMINSDSTLPFSIRRRQFPLRPAFAMTANKSQGQTLARVGIYLGRDFFSHGQLYVALSRCGNADEIKVLTRVGDKEGYKGKVMRNCVFKEVLSQLKE